MRVLLVRHGETDSNVERRIQGHKDTELNTRGASQAEEIGKLIAARETVNAVFTSPLRRAAKTAEIIAQFCGNPPVFEDPNFKERFMGPIEGMLHAEALKKRKSEGLASLHDYGENEKLLEKRLVTAWDAFCRECAAQKYETVVLVSHGSALKCLLQFLIFKRKIGFTHREVQQKYRPHAKLGNCSVTIIDNGKVAVFAEQWTESIVRESSLV